MRVAARGYRQTEIGLLPEEWELRSLSELLQFRNGVNADKEAYGSGVRFVNVLEVITKSHLVAEDVPGRVQLASQAVQAYSVERGDVLFNRTSETQEEVGLASVYLGSERVVFGGFVIRGRPLPNVGLDAEYSGYGLRGPAVRAQLIARGQGAIRANVGQAELGTVLVPLPPLSEQRAIASALRDVDSLIASLNRLIAKKRDLMEATLRDLMSGARRFPGHHEKWRRASLGSIGKWYSGGTPSKAVSRYWEGAIPWVSPKDMKRARLRDAIDHVSEEALGNGTRLLPQRALMVVVRGMILAHSAPVARAEVPVAFNQDIKGLVVDDGIDSLFILWWLVANEKVLLSKTSESTHGTKRIPTEALFETVISLPNKCEQTHIANALADMDSELAVLEQRRDKTRQLKQGMMHGLLTGRTRLV